VCERSERRFLGGVSGCKSLICRATAVCRLSGCCACAKRPRRGMDLAERSGV